MLEFDMAREGMARSPKDLEDLLIAIDKIEVAKDKHILLECLSSYLERYGVKHITMGLIVNPALISEDVTELGVSNFPDDFYPKWVKNKLIMHDPILTYAVRSKSAFEWKDAYDHANRFGKQIMDAGADVGLNEGLVVPVFTPENPSGMVSLALEKKIEDPAMRATIEVPIVHAFNRLLQFLEPGIMPAQVKLTLREVDILHYIAAGKTNWEIGMVLGITENTVKKILQLSLIHISEPTRPY